MAWRHVYNARGWVLCTCTNCGRANHVEPHGTTAKCACSAEWTEHASIPQSARDAGGLRVRSEWLAVHRHSFRIKEPTSRTIWGVKWTHQGYNWTSDHGGRRWLALGGTDSTGRVRQFTLHRDGEMLNECGTLRSLSRWVHRNTRTS